MRRKIKVIYFSRGEMDAIWKALDLLDSNRGTCVSVYKTPEWKKERRKWRKEQVNARSAQEKFWRVSCGLPEKGKISYHSEF